MEQQDKCVTNLTNQGYNREYSKGWCDRHKRGDNRTTSLGINHKGIVYNTNHPTYSFIISFIVILLLLGVGYVILHLWGLF